MKEIYIISTWPNVKFKEELLVEMITKLKKLNKEVLIASHYLIPDYITNLADYYIYDKKNEIHSYRDLNTHGFDYYLNLDRFRLEGVNISHSPALARLMNISLNFVKNLGYDYFTFIESDTQYTLEQLQYISDIRGRMINADKKLFLFKLHPDEHPYWKANGMSNIYETILFGGLVKEFLNRVVLPTTIEDWNERIKEDTRLDFLENYVSQQLLPFEKDYLILPSVVKTFPGLKVNQSTTDIIDGLYYSEVEDKLILLLWNDGNHKKTYMINGSLLLSTNKIHSTIELNPSNWWVTGVDISEANQDFNIVVYENDTLVSNTYFLVTEEFVRKQKLRKRIYFK